MPKKTPPRCIHGKPLPHVHAGGTCLVPAQPPDPVIGQTVVAVRPMTPAELEREGWEANRRHGTPMAVELSSGALLYPSRDDEGNGPGALFGYVDGKTIIFGR